MLFVLIIYLFSYKAFCINSSIDLHFAAYLSSLLSTSILFSFLIFSFSAMGISPNSPNKSSISSILPSALPSSLYICPNNVNDITPFKFDRFSAFKNLGCDCVITVAINIILALFLFSPDR